MRVTIEFEVPDVQRREAEQVVQTPVDIEFIKIPAGEFLMGSERGYDSEKPVHRVCISQGFWLAKYPVTNAQYARFLEAAGDSVKRPEFWNDRRFNQPEQPVVGVSWDEARAFCEWAGFRLPTEAEWEYACRAGTTTEFSVGDSEEQLGEYGWFDDNSGGHTQPVGAKKPNPWGLHDMYGNVWEWCNDWYARYGAEAVTDPRGPETASDRVARGGCWADVARHCWSAYRFGGVPAYRFEWLGFRVARGSSRRDTAVSNSILGGQVTLKVDGAMTTFSVMPDGCGYQNEGLFTWEYVEAVRKARRWPRADEELGETVAGAPCFVKKDGA